VFVIFTDHEQMLRHVQQAASHPNKKNNDGTDNAS
jgi:hypothetical protein